MTKGFKEFDARFTKERKRHRLVTARNGSSVYASYRSSVDAMQCWTLRFRIWDQEFVQFCVYGAADHEDWQLFRFSLKGLSTVEKLALLMQYKSDAYDLKVGDDIVDCRIDNYIGALKRGGQLDGDLRIVR